MWVSGRAAGRLREVPARAGDPVALRLPWPPQEPRWGGAEGGISVGVYLPGNLRAPRWSQIPERVRELTAAPLRARRATLLPSTSLLAFITRPL